MLNSKYLTQEGLKVYLKEFYKHGYNYIFYNPDTNHYMMSSREPEFKDDIFMYHNGKTFTLDTGFSIAVLSELLKDRNYIKISEQLNVVDWSNLPVDTKVMVSYDGENWYNNHFAKYENGTVYTWIGGGTSWSTSSVNGDWKYAELANK